MVFTALGEDLITCGQGRPSNLGTYIVERMRMYTVAQVTTLRAEPQLLSRRVIGFRAGRSLVLAGRCHCP